MLVYATRWTKESSLVKSKCTAVDCVEKQICPARKRWDPIKCKCVCRRQFKCYPINAIFNPETCTYCLQTECGDNKELNWENCKCECKYSEPAGGCGPNQVWNSISCKCEGDNEYTQLPTGEYFIRIIIFNLDSNLFPF